MESTNPVTELMDRFGGLRPMMNAIGEEHPNLLQNWEKAKRIPHYRRAQIVSAAEGRGVAIDEALIEKACPDRRRSAKAAT